jgi:hypothetical protein
MFSYDHIIIYYLHCRHVTMWIETIIMYKGNVVSLGNHQHQSLLVSSIAAACTTHHTIVCVRPRRSCSSWLRGGSGGCSYPPSPPIKITSDDHKCIPETSVGIIRRPEYRLALGTKGHCDTDSMED